MSHIVLTLALAIAATAFPSPAHAGKKVLLVNSYHEGYAWSDGIEAGAAKVLRASGVQLEFFRMDTKRNNDEKSKTAAGLAAKAAIEAAKPDVVIVSDDNAVKYVLQPFFRDAPTPFVFCGLNWDQGNYGLPYKNTTGMIEVALVKQLIDKLSEYAKGKRVGFLTVDNETERLEQRAYHEKLKIQFASERFVKTFADWKTAFREMQSQVDVLFLGNFAGINDWNEAEAKAWAEAHTRVPSGAMYDFMMPYVTLGLIKVAEEQGIFAGKAAVSILKGEAPSKIPVAANKEAQTMLNVKLATKAGIVFRPEIVRHAVVMK